MLYKILLLSFLLCSTSWATVPVERFPSGTPVQVCVPSDSNSNCGGTTSLTVGTTTIANGTNGSVEYNNNGVLGEEGVNWQDLFTLSTTQTVTGAKTFSQTITGSISGNATTATTATNLAGGLGGSIPYQTAVNATSLLANGTAGQVLTSQGTTLAPHWAPGGVSIGSPVTGSTASEVLYTNSTNKLAQSANLIFDGATLTAEQLKYYDGQLLADNSSSLYMPQSGYFYDSNGNPGSPGQILMVVYAGNYQWTTT